jgi:hypothetical protein
VTNVETSPRPDLAAHRRAVTADFPTVTRELTDVIGKKLTAYIGGAKDVRAVDRWIAGNLPYRDAEDRLRFAYRVASSLNSGDHASVVQAWLTGLNPELNDRSPIRLMREGNLDEVGPLILGAARAFLAGA